jgi:uncharacterized protein (TIGR02466 family)
MTRTEIRPDREKALTTGQEIGLLRAAYARSPTAQMRSRLLPLLMLEEAFSEAVDILTTGDPLDYLGEIALGQIYLADKASAATILAHAAAERALHLAQDNGQRARALADRAKCEIRMGRFDVARATLMRALDLDPHNLDACKRIAAVERAAGRPHAFLTIAEALTNSGVSHAQLFAEQSLAYAKTGDIAHAKSICGFDLFHSIERLVPPAGWDTMAEFNTALAIELLAHPGMRSERYGSASKSSWRIENPTRSDTPLFNLLVGQIIATTKRRVIEIEPTNHPWVNAAPRTAFLRNWCVITESEGFEDWHLHPSGWLSGVYYVRVPDTISQGTTRDGCLAFGIPENLAETDAAASFGEHLVRPQDGMMITFPSQCFHRTYPHGTNEKRICVAFDVRSDEST